MIKANGVFEFKANESNDREKCAVFFIGEVDEIVSLTITELKLRDGTQCNSKKEFVQVSHVRLMSC